MTTNPIPAPGETGAKSSGCAGERRRTLHWAGGVKHARGTYLPGWPCCCSGERCERIAADPENLTRIPERVTCRGCLRRMARSMSRAVADVALAALEKPKQACRAYEVDGIITVSVRGDRPLSPESQDALANIVRAALARMGDDDEPAEATP